MTFDWKPFLAALGLAILLEGLVWALAPDAMRRAVILIAQMPKSSIRVLGLAALALRSGSTWTASIVHLFNNLTAVALSFVPIPDDLYAKMLLPAFFVGAAGAALCFFGYVKTTRSRQYEKEETLLSSNALVLFVVALLVCVALWVFSLVAE